MGWIDNLLNEIPSASHYRLDLEAMQKENASLKDENARLKSELDALKTRTVSPDRLESEMEKMLAFISHQDYANVTQIAEALSLSKQAVEMYVEDLLKVGYIEPSYAGGPEAEYYVKQKAKRYLHSYRLL